MSLSLGVEVISYNPPSDDVKKFIFKCRLCGKLAGNIFDIYQHNIDQGHFKCMFKDCNGVKFPSQFELSAHHEAEHTTLQHVVPENSESLAPNLLPQQLVLANQSPQRSSAALPQNQSFPVPRSGYSNNSKHVEGGAGSRTDQTNSTGEEVVVLDDLEEMDYNVATPAEQRCLDVLIPNRHDTADCYVITMQKRTESVPIIGNVQSAVEWPPRPPTVDLTGDGPAPVSYPLPNRVRGRGRGAANSAHQSLPYRCPESRAVCILRADLNKPGMLEKLRQFLNQR